ncbi:MAG TPA: hypothetical protein PLC52_07130 [Anaerolineales bacterium]|nr:hypothetical protein [Anaerolineales bacterium]HRQ92623.1 hypothetical protein [Anaerolineales bacterium]
MSALQKFTQRVPALLFAAAAVLAALASLLILFTGSATQVSVTNGVETVTQLSWLEAQGWWGLAILLIFSALYAMPAFAFARGRRGLAVLFAAAGVILTILASLSIGSFYYPAAVAVVLALLVLPLTH